MTKKHTARYWDTAKHWASVFDEEFSKESDRASIIISVAMLDEALETILKTYLVPCSSEDSLMEGAYAPISTFSAKIDLAHRLGLISTRLCRDLHTIRKIRNAFAHNIKDCSFRDTAVRSRIIELVRSSEIVRWDVKTRKTFVEGPRGDFQMVVSWMLWHLWSFSERIDTIEPTEKEWGYWTEGEAKEDIENPEGE